MASPPESTLGPWLDYRTIMWVGDSAARKPEKLPLFYQRLREMGINTAMVYGDGEFGPLVENHFPFYVENMINRGLCLKWNSKVRDWDKFITGWAKEGRQETAFCRDYCLDDPEWRSWARGEMQRLVRKTRDHAPLAYNIRDELSTTFSANPFDYDINPAALAGFRAWLRTQYTSLDALNQEWDTKFASWDEVKPFSTDRIKNRMSSGESAPRGQPDWQALQQLKFEPVRAIQEATRWNFAPWADFRTYMDVSLARTLDELRSAARELDPRTPVGIEGTQMPGAFGGYDLWRLAAALDWVEPYDIGNAREIFGSFMPGKPILTTVFEKDTNHAMRRLWHLLLEGDRGCIVWWSEDCIDWQSADFKLTRKAAALAPVLKEMTSPLAALFLQASRERDPIFIHYSQPSVQVDWLMESIVDGSTWPRRFSSYEAEHNRMAKARNGWLKALQDLGYSPTFLSSRQIEEGALRRANSNAVLVLVNSWSLSGTECSEIIRFLTQHTVFCEGIPGLFDEHCKLRRASPIVESLAAGGTLSASQGLPVGGSFGLRGGRPLGTNDEGGEGYLLDRCKGRIDWPKWIATGLGAIPRKVSVQPSDCIRIHRFRLGHATLVAFERNIDYQMSEELKQAGGNEVFEKPIQVEATLASPAHIYDLRTQTYAGHSERIRFQLDPWKASLFALTTDKLPERDIVRALSGQ